MKKVLFILFLSSAAYGETLSISQYGGLNTDDSVATLPQTQTPDSENVFTDIGPGLQARTGFTSLSTQTCSGGMWVFPHSSGTRYIICHDTSANKLWASSNGGASFLTTISTVAASINTSVAALGDTLYFANTTDGLKAWNTATVSIASASLTVSQIVTHKGCIWATGKTSAARTIYKSAFGDGTSWTVPTTKVATDPAIFVIGGSLDEPLTGLYASFQDKLIWFKSNSFGGILGTSNDDFQQRVFSDLIGTSYPDSVKDCKGFLRWLGSARTIWEFDGSTLKDLTQQPESKIKTLIGTVLQGDANQRTYNITSQTDFNNGTNYQTTNAIVAGDVLLSTTTRTDTTTADFTAGTTSNTTVSSNRVYLSTNNNNVTNNDFETGNCSDGWTGSGPCSFGGTFNVVAPFSGSKMLTINSVGFTGTTTGQLLDTGGNVLTSVSGSATTSWQQLTLNTSSYVGRYVKLRFTFSGISNTVTTTDFFLCSGTSITFYIAKDAFGGNDLALVDLEANGVSTVFSGTFTSSSYDTTLTSAAWTATGANWTTNSHSISAQTQSSSDGSSWQTAVSWSTGSAPGSDFRRYIRYILTLSTGGTTNGTALPYVDDVTLAARANRGTYVSQSIPMSGATAWGVFEADHTLDSETITYAIYSDSDAVKTVTNGIPVSGTWVSSQTITSGSIPTISTAAYAFIVPTFSLSTSSHDPAVHGLTLRWSEGSTLETPSIFYDGRYELGVAINSTTNNRILVFDRNRQWQRWSGINTASAVLYNGTPIFSNSSGVFTRNTSYSDNGSAIAAYYRTPTFSPSGPHLISDFNELLSVSDNSTETLATSFQVNGVTNTDYSLGSYAMNTTDGIQAFKLPFSSSEIQQGRNISFKFSVSGTTFWRLLGVTFDFTPDLVVP